MHMIARPIGLPVVAILNCFLFWGCTTDPKIEEATSSDQIAKKLSREAQSGRYVFEDGSLFEGELVVGLPDGYGTIKYVSGDLYEGQFAKGLSNGYGTIRYKSDENLEKYSGNWENGKRSGFGALTMTDQSVLEGHWEQGGLKYGEFRDAEGRISYGKWLNNQIDEGTLFLPNGNQFTGVFKPDGSYDFGTLNMATGAVYYGEFANGLFHGKGILTDENGIQYTGGFLEGLKSGVGVLRDLDGSVYTGEFANGYPHGRGRQSDVTGVTYVGSWEDGQKQGDGVLDFGDGTSYVGEFENGRAVDGVYTWEDGTTSRSYQDENGAWQDYEE